MASVVEHRDDEIERLQLTLPAVRSRAQPAT
jgi:hypothetical protein